MQRPEYQKIFAISQSAIKAFKTKTIQDFYDLYIEQREDGNDDKFAFGSLVDTIAFTPNLLDERFYKPDYSVEIPGEKVKFIVDKVYAEAIKAVETKNLLNEKGQLPEPLYVPNITDLYEWSDLVWKYAAEIEFGGSKWKKDRIMDTVANDGQNYFRLLSESQGRHIITEKDNIDAVEIVETLAKDPTTAKYFSATDGCAILLQHEIFVDHEYVINVEKAEGEKYAVNTITIPLKCAIDIAFLDHKNKKARIIDLKTTHTSEMFLKIAREYGYITQVSFYTTLLKSWLKLFEDGIYADYEVEAPINVVIDRKYKIPYVYEYDWDDLDIAENGSAEKNIEGWRETLDNICWHIHNKVWDKPRELHETGKIKLKIFK